MSRALLAAGRGSAYCLAILPLSLVAVAAALLGRAGTAAGWWSRMRERVLGVPSLPPIGRVTAAALLGHALLSMLLGVAALVPLGIELLMVLRGLLYGLVDRGPYDHSWGGPSMAGAWLAHFAVGIPFTVVAALALIGIAAVHQRLTTALAGQPRAPWLVPVALMTPLPAIAFFLAWLHQI
ncbi:MAG TPA: hypothetical protein VFX61_01375 [Micromonosporaceae bacterium]|nr:hypothetical protein [Micromonosporaceae bacterium]